MFGNEHLVATLSQAFSDVSVHMPLFSEVERDDTVAPPPAVKPEKGGGGGSVQRTRFKSHTELYSGAGGKNMKVRSERSFSGNYRASHTVRKEGQVPKKFRAATDDGKESAVASYKNKRVGDDITVDYPVDSDSDSDTDNTTTKKGGNVTPGVAGESGGGYEQRRWEEESISYSSSGEAEETAIIRTKRRATEESTSLVEANAPTKATASDASNEEHKNMSGDDVYHEDESIAAESVDNECVIQIIEEDTKDDDYCDPSLIRSSKPYMNW